MSKGDKRRPRIIDRHEEDLRWELIDKNTTVARKAEILLLLKELKMKNDNF